MLSIEDFAVFCKKKGFVYPSAEIYGGLSGFFDFGSLGVELKNNIKNELWKEFVQIRGDIIGVDGSIITHDKVWQASGHVESFEDFILECKKCKNKVRADLLIEDKLKINVEGMKRQDIDNLIKKNNIKCECGGEYSNAKSFNLMFSTEVGPMSNYLSYLRPETAQLIFINFKLLMENNRMKLPFAIAQIGKAFRNEISPRDFLFRIREFEMFEIEYFVDPNKLKNCPYIKDVLRLKMNILTKEMQKSGKQHKETTVNDILKKKINPWLLYWIALFYKWFLNLGIKKENLRLREHLKDELAHYASACFDIEYKFPFGWKEIHGNADRSKYDLTQHMKYSKSDLSVYNEETKERVVPYVASEPSQGIERAFLAFMYDAYNDDKKRGNIVLKLNPKLAPIKVTVLPLVNKLEKEAKRIYTDLKNCFNCFYDSKGSIGRRYSRQDEIGTPLCCTIDFQTLKDKTVTLRERDTTHQVRVKIKDLKDKIFQYIYEGKRFKDLGKVVK